VRGTQPGAPVTTRAELRDGRVALIAPLHPDDRGRYLVGLEQLSAESVYQRFLAPVERLSESQLRYLLEVDHRDHEALLAIDEEGGHAVGVARFIRSEESPEVAEAAITVVDEWQRQGLGKCLGQLLSDRARELGVARFEATLLSENEAIQGLLRSLGPMRTVGRDGAAVRVEIELPAEGMGEQMAGVLRVAAASDEVEQLTPPVGLRQLG
jgi:RimJ/RimL family protein N-acetyltransferase